MKLSINKKKMVDWFQSRNLRFLDYQFSSLNKINDNLHSEALLSVLAACPSAGKTLMSIFYIDQFVKENPKAKVLVLTHGQTILKSQYANNLHKYVSNKLNWKVLIGKKESITNTTIPESFYLKMNNFITDDSNIFVALPQMLYKLDKLPKFDLIVIDEAHQMYFTSKNTYDDNKGMVQKILKMGKKKDSKELLLTGTPSPFILRGSIKYPIVPITVNQLHDYDMISDLKVELMSSAYDITKDDYDSQYEVRNSKKFTKEDTNITMSNLLDALILRLKSEFKDHPEKYAALNKEERGHMKGKTWNDAFTVIKKTMFACRSIEQAKYVFEYLKNQNIQTVLSTSDNDTESVQIQDFINQKEIQVLVVVNRGILGFDLPELETVIDMTCTGNIDRIFQLMARVLRKHPDNKPKMFFKLSPSKLAGYFEDVMNVTLSLNDERNYLKYNGKNFLDMEFLSVVKRTEKRTGKTSKPTKSKPKVEIKKVNFEGLDVIQHFKHLYHKDNAAMNGYAYTTMRRVRAAFFQHNNASLSLVELVEKWKTTMPHINFEFQEAVK